MAPVAKYTRSGDLHIAYIVEGEAPLDLIWVPTWIGQCEYLWSEPTLAGALERLTSFSRFITFDRRGPGLSDPMLFAATPPERTQALILYATFARATWAEDYTWTWTREERDARMEQVWDRWGE